MAGFGYGTPVGWGGASPVSPRPGAGGGGGGGGGGGSGPGYFGMDNGGFSPRTTLNPGENLQQDFLSPNNQSLLQASPYQQQQNQYQNALNFFSASGGYDPASGTTAQGQQYTDRQNAMIGQTLANRNYQGGLLNENYLQNMAGNQLSQRANQALQGRWSGDLALLAQSGQLLGQQRDLSKRAAWQGADTAQRGALSQIAASGGAVATQGTRDTMGDIGKTLSNQITGADIQYKQGQNSLAQQRNLDNARLEQARIQGQQYGLQGEHFKTELKSGLEKLNIDSYVNVNTLLDNINSQNASDRQAADAIIRNALQFSNLFPTTAQSVPGSSTPSIRPPTVGPRRNFSGAQ